jgi:hypothetical protein
MDPLEAMLEKSYRCEGVTGVTGGVRWGGGGSE